MILDKYTKHVAQIEYVLERQVNAFHNNEFFLRTHIAPPPAGPIALNNEAKLIESPLAAPLLS